MTAAADPRMSAELKKQLGFLQRSARAFDGGHEEEAVRLATTMRVLFHDTSQSTSLLTHLSMAGTTMLSTPRTDFADWRDFLNIQLDPDGRTGGDPVKFLPKLQPAFIPVPFTDWWESDSITAAAGTTVTRKRIILGAANKDGGAHVDPKLGQFYSELAKGTYGLGITANIEFDGPAPYPQGATQYARNGHLALLRQIAHEVERSAIHYKWV